MSDRAYEGMQVQTLGGFALRARDRSIGLVGKKSRAIIGYLAIEGEKETRERLIGLLWSESEEGKARASLRQCLHEVRDAFRKEGFDGLETEGDLVALGKGGVRVDILELIERARNGVLDPQLLEAKELTSHLLTEVETVDPVFRTWLFAKRQHLQDLIIRHLEASLRSKPVCGSEGEDVAAAILNLDPTHEEACRFLMSSKAQRGDTGGALRAYKQLWDLLDQEYDVEPAAQTQQLVAEIKLAQPLSSAPLAEADLPGPSLQTLPSATPRATEARLVLSVAPFDVAAVASSRHYVVNGFRRELIAYLVRFREWLVHEQYAKSATAEGRPDEYKLEADAMETAGHMRLVLTLRECASNAYLWSENLRLSLENWSEVQQAVVQRIATALNIHVSIGRLALTAPTVSTDTLAYDLWLRGQAQFLTYEPVGWQRAAELYRECVARHPQFAPAYSSMAQLQNTVHFVHPGVFRSKRATQEALTLATEATRLDPMDSRARLCLGWAYAMSDRHDQAAVHHKLAYELNENDPWTLVSAALGSAFRGEHEQARLLADRALELSPNPSGTHWRYQAMIRYMCRDFVGCIAAAEPAETSIQNVFFWKAAALIALGRKQEAEVAAEKFFTAVEKSWFGPDAPPSKRLMTRWILHGFPIARAEDFEALRRDFGGTGAPVENIQHNSW
jgi:DNA-binding SARP family transcriptional activator/TolB-like protein